MGGWPDYSMGVPLDPKNPWKMRRKWRLWVTIVWSIYLHETLKLIKKCRKNAPALLSIMGFLVAFIGYKFLPGALASHNLPFSTQNIPFIYQLHQAPLSVWCFFSQPRPKKGTLYFCSVKLAWNMIPCSNIMRFMTMFKMILLMSMMNFDPFYHETMSKSPGHQELITGTRHSVNQRSGSTSCFLMGPW